MLGPEFKKIQMDVGKQILSMYEKAEMEVLAHPEFSQLIRASWPLCFSNLQCENQSFVDQ